MFGEHNINPMEKKTPTLTGMCPTNAIGFYSKLETGGIFRAFTLSVNSWKCHVEKIGFTWPSMEAKSGLKKAKDICCMLLYERG